MILFGNTRHLFNIETNPIHADWKDVSFTSDITIEPKGKFSFLSGIDITLSDDEEVFIEEVYQEEQKYDIHFGTIIVNETCQELTCYVENLTDEEITIPANLIHTWFYCARKNWQGEKVIENNDFILISKKGSKIKNMEYQIEMPENKHFLKIEVEPIEEEDGQS